VEIGSPKMQNTINIDRNLIATPAIGHKEARFLYPVMKNGHITIVS
jgi:hypothetical protein